MRGARGLRMRTRGTNNIDTTDTANSGNSQSENIITRSTAINHPIKLFMVAYPKYGRAVTIPPGPRFQPGYLLIMVAAGFDRVLKTASE